MDSDVYAISEESTLNGDIVKVWKNEVVLYTLSEENNLATVQGLFVIGSDVYVTGYEGIGDGEKTVAKVWKNESVLYELNSNDTNSARAYSIFVK